MKPNSKGKRRASSRSRTRSTEEKKVEESPEEVKVDPPLQWKIWNMWVKPTTQKGGEHAIARCCRNKKKSQTQDPELNKFKT